MKLDLHRIDLASLPIRLQVLAVLLHARRPLSLDDILARLDAVGVAPRQGIASIRRALTADSCVQHHSDGRLRVDLRHAGYARDRARIEAATRAPREQPPPEPVEKAPRAAARVPWTRVRRCDREAPRIEATWLGSRRPVAAAGVFDQDMDLLIWLDATAGRVRAFDVVPRGEAPHRLAALLETAIHEPIDGCTPAVPSLVAVDVLEGRLDVERTAEAHGADPVERDVSALDAVYIQLQREIASPVLAIGDDPQALNGFYTACRALLAAAPWVGVSPGEVLRLDGLGPAPLHVVMVAAPPVGMLVFLDESAALDFLLRGRSSASPLLTVRFHSARRVAAAATVAAAHGWRGDLVPVPSRVTGDAPRVGEPADIALLTAVADAVVRLTFARPFRDRAVRLSDGRRVKATWPLLASPFRVLPSA